MTKYVCTVCDYVYDPEVGRSRQRHRAGHGVRGPARRLGLPRVRRGQGRVRGRPGLRMGVLELRDVTLDLGGRRILNGLTVDFWEGHVHALIGPNGAGKSTLAGAIMGLPDYRHLSGEILLDGEPIQDLPVDERARRGITLAWQEPARFEGLRVDRFILAGARDQRAARRWSGCCAAWGSTPRSTRRAPWTRRCPAASASAWSSPASSPWSRAWCSWTSRTRASTSRRSRASSMPSPTSRSAAPPSS